MNTDMKEIWRRSVDFWNTAYECRDDPDEVPSPDAWRSLAPSKKQLLAVTALGRCRKVLDYGCGDGWGAVIAAKSGCPSVDAVDTAENGILRATEKVRRFGVEGQVRCLHISADWLRLQAPEQWDGFFSSNVLDVVPDEIADDILAGADRVLRHGARLVISLNHCPELRDDPGRGVEIRDGHCLYVNGVFRLSCHTDEFWAERLGHFFRVESLGHYAWPGEAQERRRLFLLVKP